MLMDIKNYMRIVIAGAGIGGLVTALALHRSGFTNITLIESAKELKALGLGISLRPEAIRILYKLGLTSGLEAVAVQTTEVQYMDNDGNLVWRHLCGRGAANEYPQCSIHRGELQVLLVSAVRRVLGVRALRTGIKVERVEQSPREVTVQCKNQRTGDTLSISADLLIGADGIDSVVRAGLHPSADSARLSPIIMWRGATLLDHFLDGKTMTLTHDQHWSRLVVYPISKPALDTDRILVNWACLVPAEKYRLDHPSGWSQSEGLESILKYFSGWNLDWIDIQQLLHESQVILHCPMVDRDPLPFWSMGRVTLLGDAAHLMYPMGSNGASQAILDAAMLAKSLVINDRFESALIDYECKRRDAVGRLVFASRKREAEERAAAVIPLPDKKVVFPRIIDNYRLSTKDSRDISI